jgi:hypothetical protein
MFFSSSYVKQLQSVHNYEHRPSGFGANTKKLGQFNNYFEKWQPQSMLDYGCGKGWILNSLVESYPSCNIVGYDPAVNEYQVCPQTTFDCVFSIDVLEHIEPDYIDSVLDHINQLSNRFIWLRIDTLPARKRLPDKRNAHLIIEQPPYWIEKIKKHIDGEIVYEMFGKKAKLDVAIEK